jgi:uncharacterized damage-inducible protein DinB
MHSRTHEVLEHLETYHSALCSAVESVPAELREREPAEGRWSVAGVLEHLAIVEEGIAKRLSGALTVARESGLAPEADQGSVLRRLDIATVLDRSRPRVASPQAQPASGAGADAAMAHFERAHAGVCDLLREYDGLAIGTVMAPHPVLGDLDIYQWLLFVGAHEGRHAEQIREIADSLGQRDEASRH